MQTGKSNVKSVFDGHKIFNIPIYQRAYSWDVENLQEFLSDIKNQHSDRKYFFGSFLFHITGVRNDFTLVDVVDGQQRLTTFIIFIKILINKLITQKSNVVSQRTEQIFVKHDEVFKLELLNEDNSFLHNYILSDAHEVEISSKTPSQALLQGAKSFFTTELIDLDTSVLEKLYFTITEAEVLLYVVEEISSATQIFELLNDRGKKLTDLEAIKSFLMYNIGLISKNPDQLIKNVQKNFGEIYRLIEAYDLKEEDILRYHTIAFESSDQEPKSFIKNKVLKLISERSIDALIRVISGYAVELQESFEIYAKIQQLKGVNTELSKLFMIGLVAPFYPVLMLVNKKAPLLFNPLLQNINNFTFRASLVGLRGKAEIKINAEIKNSEKLDHIVNFIGKIVQNNLWNINERAKESVTSKSVYHSLNKNILKFILFTYENKLRQRKGFPLLGVKEYFNENGNKREMLNIEHITAQRSDLIFDKDFEEHYLNNIGNLVIDCVASNSSKGKRNARDKMDAYHMAPLMSQNELDDINCDWGDIEDIKRYITERELKLNNFIADEFKL